VLGSVAGVLAGCGSLGADAGDEGGGDPPGSPITEESDPVVERAFELGEPAAFFRGDEEFIFKPFDADVTNVVTYTDGDRIRAETPDGGLFLRIRIDVENYGEREAAFPVPELRVGGSAYEPVSLPEQVDDQYIARERLPPGVRTFRTLVFSIPEADGEASLFVRSDNEETTTAEWQLSLSDIDRSIVTLEGNRVGDPVQFGTDEQRYVIAVTDVDVTDSHPREVTPGSGLGDAGSDRQWVLATVRAENVGEEPVAVPTTFDVRVIAAERRFNGSPGWSDGEYSGGVLSPGSSTAGPVSFEVTADVTDVTIAIDLAADVTATWNA